MRCQILTFTLDELTDDDYARICTALAAECADLPDLAAQRWAVNPATHTLSGTLRWKGSGQTHRARQAADHMTVALHFSPTQVTEREIRLPERITVKPTAHRAT
jgi:hypothetical protein